MSDSSKPVDPQLQRRRLLQGTAAGTVLSVTPFLIPRIAGAATTPENAHEAAAATAKQLAAGRSVTLKILQPSGSLGNIKPAADRFTAATGIKFDFIEVPNGEINQKILLEAVSKSGAFDIALPATFGIPDLAESGILVNLDTYAQKHEPQGFRDDDLYTIGDYYKGSLFGYQTDGDTYLTFYRKDWLEDAEEKKRFADKNGYALKVPETWEEFDATLAHFHRPDKGRYGGALFRTQYFIAW
ncbi:MAG: extracellular solute-binding protein, partial [Burkholderiales bacterium]|nr:extracellular solute-binding protein [Burkholderiales bacterium]